MKLTGNRCQCTGCGAYFGAVGTFDAHRYGKYEEGRKCLTSEQMAAKGWFVNARGFWVRTARPEFFAKAST